MCKQMQKELVATAASAGAFDIQIVYGGKHPKLCGQIAGTKFKFPFPGTPGDWRSQKNCICALKRLLFHRVAERAVSDLNVCVGSGL